MLYSALSLSAATRFHHCNSFFADLSASKSVHLDLTSDTHRTGRPVFWIQGIAPRVHSSVMIATACASSMSCSMRSRGICFEFTGKYVAEARTVAT